MKILKIEYENIGLFRKGFVVDFTATDRVVNAEQVTHVYHTSYTQNVIGFVGINATGKTSALRLLDIAMDIVMDNKGLDDINIPSGMIGDGTVLTVYFYLKDTFYKLVSRIGQREKSEDNLLNDKIYYFKDETVFSKLKSTVKSKEMLFDFKEAVEVISRKEIKDQRTFLKEQDSIISAITMDLKTMHYDMIFDTNFNYLWTQGVVKPEFVSLFDRSIDSITIKKKKTAIRFKNRDGVVESENLLDVVGMLSSGTIKGINLLEKASMVLKVGGYLLIDEIENHMHKKLVQTIIRFFTDADVNQKGATLIFSTHYAEIIDTIERKDNIYVLRKTEDLYSECIRYSDEIKRNDIKKSEVFLSNLIEGTAPNYEDIKVVRDYLCR